MTAANMMSFEEAVRELQARPEYADLLRDSYLDGDPHGAAIRFKDSAEFAEVRRIAGRRRLRGVVVDVGAGTGIASYAFAVSGAAETYAVEPDPSDHVGRGAIARACAGLDVRLIDSFGEKIPLSDEIADVVYARQVLHHARDLDMLVAECARILKPGGIFIASREHVADDDEQLRLFLRDHPIHYLAGCENAYPLPRYQHAILGTGLRLRRTLGPWDSVVNAFPGARSQRDMLRRRAAVLRPRLGPLARLAAVAPWLGAAVARRLDVESASVPGRLFTFVAVKPRG